MAQYVMGVDNGGTVIKAALFRLDGILMKRFGTSFVWAQQ